MKLVNKKAIAQQQGFRCVRSTNNETRVETNRQLSFTMDLSINF
jgi:hypothetical protein